MTGAEPTELCVHLACGAVRGPVPNDTKWTQFRGRWQPCPCEADRERWGDVAEVAQLCVVCLRGSAGGPSRWSWLACGECLSVNQALQAKWGVRPLPLGRHSLMNGVGIPGGSPPEVVSEETARMLQFVRRHRDLYEWRREEFGRLATAFPSDLDVPLRVWQQRHPSNRTSSIAAFSRLFGRDIDLEAET